MKDRIDEGKLGYIVDNLIWLYAIAFLFYKTCYMPIRGFYYGESKYIYWGLVLAGTVVGIVLTMNRRRNFFTAFVNVALPVQVYLLISSLKYLSPVFAVLLVISILLSIVYFIIVMTRRINSKKYKQKILMKRAGFGILGARTVATVLLMSISLPVCISLGTGNGLITSSVDKNIKNSGTEWTFENHNETLTLLDEDKWKTLDIQEKMDVLATVKNIEMNEFGIVFDVKLDTKPLDDGVIGEFDGEHMVINIDSRHLENDPVEEVVDTVLHESMHAYQHVWEELYSCVSDEYKELKFIRKGEKYLEENSGYISSSEDMEGYYGQYIEREARAYAADRLFDYYRYIYPFLIDGKEENT